MFAPGWTPTQPHPPYGVYKGVRGWVNEGWAYKEKLEYDYGFVVLKPNAKGEEVQNAVGANGLEINEPYKAERTVIGYVGDHQHGCVGQSRLRFPISYSDQLRIDCAGYRAGASGGPWIDAYNARKELGIVNGVNSTLLSPTDDSAVLSPYFGDATWSLYQTAAATR